MPSPMASAKVSVMSAWRVMAKASPLIEMTAYRDRQYAARIRFGPKRELTDLKANRKRPTLGQTCAYAEACESQHIAKE